MNTVAAFCTYVQTCTMMKDRNVHKVINPHAVPTPPREVNITRVLQDAIELNWLPPTEPNGEVHYVIYYTPEGGIEQSIDTGRDLTHYNLTGLERNRTYTNFAVQAVNIVGKSERRPVIVLPGEVCSKGAPHTCIHCARMYIRTYSIAPQIKSG